MLYFADKKKDIVSKKGICHNMKPDQKHNLPHQLQHMTGRMPFFSRRPFECSLGAVIQRSFTDDERKQYNPADALNVLKKVIEKRDLELSDLEVDIKNIDQYYNVSQKYTERELAERFSLDIFLREKMLSKYPSAMRDVSEQIISPEDDNGKISFLQNIITKMMYYHVTREENADIIYREGLKPTSTAQKQGAGISIAGISKIDMQNTFKKWSIGWIFLTDSFNQARKYKEKIGSAGVILHIFADPKYVAPRLEIDADSEGLKSDAEICAVGYNGNLNSAALELIRETAKYKGLSLQDSERDNGLIQEAYVRC